MEYAHYGFGGKKITADDIINKATDIFLLPEYDEDIEAYNEVSFTADNLTDDNGPYRIVITANNSQYIWLSKCYLKLHLHLQRMNGVAITYEQCFVVPNIGNSLFETIQVDINNIAVEDLTQHQNAYKSYIESVLSYNPACVDSIFAPRLMIPDEPSFYDSDTIWKNYDFEAGVDKDKRTSEEKRYAIWRRQHYLTDGFRGNMCEIVTPLSVDIFQTDRLIPPKTSISLSFKRGSANFCNISKTAINYKIKIIDMKLIVPFITLNPILRLEHEHFFSSGQVASIPFQKVSCHKKQFPTGLSELSFDNCIQGSLPKHVLVAIVKTADMDGIRSTSPFIFQHINVKKTYLRINNLFFPSEPITADFEHRRYAEAYTQFLRNLSLDMNDHACMVDFRSYGNDYTFFAFDLSPSKSNGFLLHKPINGNLDVKMELSIALTTQMSMLVFATYDKVLRLNKNRDASVANI